MKEALTILQIVVSILLIISIILQSRGSEAGMTFAGGGETYRSKRGIEKFLFYATIIFAAFFAAISLLSLVVR